MPYLGKEPQFESYPVKFFNGDGTAMTVTLDYAPPSLGSILVFIDGVRQDTTAYTLSSTSLTFTGTVPSGTNNVQVVHLGLIEQVPTPDDASVTAAKLSTTGTASSNTFLRGDMAWADVMPTGTSGEEIFYNNETEVNNDYTVPSSTNSMSAGPVTVASGITITVSSGSTWTVV
jgi:hypothetical protein